MTIEKDFFGADVGIETSSDVDLLEALIVSPAFAAFKRLIAQEQKQIRSALETTTEMAKVYQLQGRLAGTRVLEVLPALIVKKRTADRAKTQEAEMKEAEAKKRNAWAPTK